MSWAFWRKKSEQEELVDPAVVDAVEKAVEQLRSANSTLEEALRHYRGDGS